MSVESRLSPRGKRSASRVVGLDAARVLATLGIVWVHVSEVQGQDERLNTLGRFGTSFYILAAVFFAARSHINSSATRSVDVIKRRAKRLLIPYVLWCAIYAAFYLTTMGSQGYSFASISQYWGPLFGTAPHLWFLPFAFVAGAFASLTMPRLLRVSGVTLMIVGAALTLGAYYVVYDWLFLLLDRPWTTEVRLHRLSRWAEEIPLVIGAVFGLAIYGHYLPRISRWGRAKRHRVALWALVGFVITEVCYFLFLEKLGGIFWNRVRFLSNVAGAFWLIGFVAARRGKWLQRLAPLGSATYFAYLSHQLILDSVKRLLTFVPGYGSLWFAALSTLGIFGVAVGLGLLVARVRMLRWLSP